MRQRNANKCAMCPPLCLRHLRSAAFILAVLCSFASICILLLRGGGLALYAKMVNFHSYAFASTKMENSKWDLPSRVLCALRCLSVQHIQGRAIRVTLPPE